MTRHLAPPTPDVLSVVRALPDPLRRDWAQIARRLEEAEGAWVIVYYEPLAPPRRGGRVGYVRERLARYGVHAQVISMRGFGPNQEHHPDRTWTGWLTFARWVP